MEEHREWFDEWILRRLRTHVEAMEMSAYTVSGASCGVATRVGGPHDSQLMPRAVVMARMLHQAMGTAYFEKLGLRRLQVGDS